MARKQNTLFDVDPVADDHPAAFARIVFNRPMPTIFTYAVNADLAKVIAAGKRIVAPFGKGNRPTTGFCVGVEAAKSKAAVGELKWIRAVVDDLPLLSGPMLELTRWISEYYLCSWGQVLDAVLPRAVKDKSGARWVVMLEPASSPPTDDSLTPRQRSVFEALAQFRRPVPSKELANAVRCGPDVIRALIRKGRIVAKRQRLFFREPTLQPIVGQRPPELNPEQSQALAEISKALDAGVPGTFLLYGVTGSGKTEVYLRAIQRVVDAGKQAIVLVPEISLTPQTILRFRQRFDHVAVLHSHLPDVERNWHWRRIASGEVSVVVGARSAVFAPCPRLGVIVIDEEHEHTFKQESAPRYHARDVAIQRSMIERAPLILGSATPSLESWMAARDRRIQLLSLTRRVAGLEMPKVSVVDMRDEYRKSRGFRTLSLPLERAIDEALADRGQVILLLNRRGFATTVFCPMCGRVERCAHCDIALVYHRGRDRLICHACDADFDPPRACPQCKHPEPSHAGLGTERLEDVIRRRFPGAVAARMDSDTMRSAAHYERVLGDFRNGKIDILLGTQMIAKGLDFPNVRVVGVVSADTTRSLPDFRAAERTFQLLAQVAGRTGRGAAPGRVFIQTFNPEDPVIQTAAQHDFRSFAAHELHVRSDFGYPPYQCLARIILRSEDLESLRTAARDAAGLLRSLSKPDRDIRVLGPAVPPIARINNYHRAHLQVHADQTTRRRRLLADFVERWKPPTEVEFAIDVDPVNLM